MTKAKKSNRNPFDMPVDVAHVDLKNDECYFHDELFERRMTECENAIGSALRDIAETIDRPMTADVSFLQATQARLYAIGRIVTDANMAAESLRVLDRARNVLELGPYWRRKVTQVKYQKRAKVKLQDKY